MPETLPSEVLRKMHAQSIDIPEITVAELKEADGLLLGFPTRFGTAPAQMKAFWDATGSLWGTGALAGKYCGLFTSTNNQHGGKL